MNKVGYKSGHSGKSDVDQLVGFQGEEDSVRSSRKAKDESLSQVNLPSKYAKVITCSFEDGERPGSDMEIPH